MSFISKLFTAPTILQSLIGSMIGTIIIVSVSFFILNQKLDQEIFHNNYQCRQEYPPSGTIPGGGNNEQNKVPQPNLKIK
jgi:hypothetical protein